MIGMSLKKAISKYKIEPGMEVDLTKISTNDKSLYDGGKNDSQKTLEELQLELKELQHLLYAENKRKLLVVIQAMDAGGKDGTVKKVFARVDPQGIHVEAFKKPTEDELGHDFLWRIHKLVPGAGQISVFNRSHYEDIIAVRVKKIFEDAVWQRRYRHVIDFEQMLADEGTQIVKIFLHISKDEQKERFESRLEEEEKHWKFNPDDLKDRAKWDEFMHAYGDLLTKTSKEHAPWYVIPADRKWYRNLVISQIIIDTLKSMNMEYPTIDWDVNEFKLED